MESNSDESDYEGESFVSVDNDESIGEVEAYPNFFKEDGHNKRKRHATLSDEASRSESDDSDGNENYCNRKFKPQIMYQDLSCKQDSADEDSSQIIQNNSMEDPMQNSNDEAEQSRTMRVSHENTFHFAKKQKLYKTKDKADENTTKENKDYSTKEQIYKQEPKSTLSGSDKGKRMMLKMGFEDGHGLGKHKQGRLEPVQASKQHSRRGFGHHVPELEASASKWDPKEEEIKVIEDMEWISNSNVDLPTAEKMQDWLQKGPKKLVIDDEFTFCHKEVVTNVLNAKIAFDNIDSAEIKNIRTRCNPFETIHGSIFLNRAAVKMANMDKACDFMFTNPETLGHDDLLYFADVCAGPGGFSEYVLWKSKRLAKGFGFTLKNENDFKLEKFYAGPCETFHPFYGPKDNGDVYDPSNQKAFKKLIMRYTHGKGVHFMMSDGGFSVKGQCNIQEILSKQLYLCQCLVALMIVREKGHFVTKLFDIFTSFSAGLVYLMYRCFEKVCIFKPNSSRPANSERYLICKSKRAGIQHIVEYLERANEILLKGDDKNDVVQLVPLKELEREAKFLQYLRSSNERLGKKQVISLRKISAFCEDTTLVEEKQAEMRIECLKYWELPDTSRTAASDTNPSDRIRRMLQNSTFEFSKAAKSVTIKNIKDVILNDPYNWFCVPCGNVDPQSILEKGATFFLGMGRSNVYYYQRNTWKYLDSIKLELPPDTLVYGEIVMEMTKESKAMRKIPTLHIIDAFILGGKNIGDKYLCERHKLTKKFCEALWKPESNEYTRIRAKELIPVFSNICEMIPITSRITKNGSKAFVYQLTDTSLDSIDSDNDKPYFILSSIIFLVSVAYPWKRHPCNSHVDTYLYNAQTRASKFERNKPDAANASFTTSFTERVIWHLPHDEFEETMETFAKLVKTSCRPSDSKYKYYKI